MDTLVPNVPCGVERSLKYSFVMCEIKFLMYRVELKGFPFTRPYPS